MTVNFELTDNWDRPQLAEAIMELIAELGIDLAAATPHDLAFLDQFHGGSMEATLQLANKIRITPGMKVLDVGGAVGGPARTLAYEFDAQVTVVDITANYIAAGKLLTAGMGLSEKVVFQQGSGIELPVDSGSFDVVWTQNSGMNIRDKQKLYSEFNRVLKPGGWLAQMEPVAGTVQPPHFPIMWAADASESHLLTPSELRSLILDSGFTESFWDPDSRFKAIPSNHPASIQKLVKGEQLGVIRAAGKRNRDERRVLSVLAVFKKLTDT